MYSALQIREEGLGAGIVAVNSKSMWSTLGYAIYAFEGVGILMPVMQACECPEKYDKILVAALVTLTLAFVVYGTMSYLAFGNMKEQMVT